MTSSSQHRRKSFGTRSTRRSGLSGPTMMFGVALTASICAAVGWKFWSPSDKPVIPHSLLTAEVVSGPFIHEVRERGEIESSSNVEVRCEVRARSSSGTNILEIVPEGTIVKKGDFLIRLDDASFQTELIQQQIDVSGSQSQYIEAKAALEAAKLALSEYKFGTFKEQEEQLESTLFVSEEDVRRAAEYLRYSERLAERGYVTEVQLEADKFAVQKAQKELDVAKTKLMVLREFTKKKMETQLQAAIDTAAAKLDARQKTWELDKFRLAEIQEQISKCEINAPAAGQVVYANDAKSRSSSGDLLIEEGRPVRERQVLIRLPDPSKMQVVTKVHESRISHIKPGLTASVILDAKPDVNLVGTVQEVGEYPLPSRSVYLTHVKEYEVKIEISEPPAGLRPGMSAQVHVLVDRIPDATLVPWQAVVGREGRYFCAVQDESGELETRELEIGLANDEHVTVHKGLRLGENVVMSPSQIESVLELPFELASKHRSPTPDAMDKEHKSSQKSDKKSDKSKKPKIK